MVDEARKQADKGLSGRMEGHADMDMSVSGGPFLRRLFSPRAFTAVSHYFFGDVYSLWQDLLLGFLIAGALAAWVPNSFWQSLFLSRQPALSAVWDPWRSLADHLEELAAGADEIFVYFKHETSAPDLATRLRAKLERRG